jgi:radical SAM/Cys-rich protein
VTHEEEIMTSERSSSREFDSDDRDTHCRPASFLTTLASHDLELTRDVTATLQINTGLLCNQACRHCHLEAGPNRTELMGPETIEQVVGYAQRGGFQTVDVTGGAPEMNPHLCDLIEDIAPFAARLMLRSNLTALVDRPSDGLIELAARRGVVIVASLPASNASQTDSQRGKGVWEKSLEALRMLNAVGYGVEGSGLELDFVANPTGAFLPPSQEQAEKKFKGDLDRRWGIVFNRLYTFGNAPLGRFRKWLDETGNLDRYMECLVQAFNPCTIDGLMCRTLVSVAWDGYLYDCDFNLAQGLHLGGRKTHVSEMTGPPEPGTHIAAGDHCYACTAGSGFT